MEKKEDLEIGKVPEELTEQDLEKVTGGMCSVIQEHCKINCYPNN